MRKDLILFVLLFCFVFAFYIGGISISFLVSIPLYIFSLLSRKYRNALLFVFRCKYITSIVTVWGVVVFLSIIFPIVYSTWDFSLFRVVVVQIFHLFAAFPLLAYLRYKAYTYEQIEQTFVWIFVVQTIIQCIVMMSPTLTEVMYSFNKFDPEAVEGPGSNIRGKALSAATTYHLSLVYGIAFIIYLKRFLALKVSLKNILIGILVFVGIFFAGRTGFVGVIIGGLGYVLYFRVKWTDKIRLFFYALVGCGMFIILIYLLFPVFYEALENYILPYAFEFLYSLDTSGQMETASTNHLLEMWQRDFNYMEFFFGSGKYSNSTGGYYMRVDPGILRHTLFMGILGYVVLIVYQFVLLPIHKLHGQTRFYYTLIMLYLCVMDLKGCTLGTNKFVFAVSILLIFSYTYLPKEDKIPLYE